MNLDKKISYGLLKGMKYYSSISLNVCFIPLLRQINEINSKNDYKAVVKFSYAKFASGILSFIPCFFLGFLIRKMGAIRTLDIQILVMILLNIILAFFPGFIPLLIQLCVASLFLYYDICLNSMINWTTREDFTNAAKINELVLHILIGLAPFCSTWIISFFSRAWEIYFLSQAFLFAAALAFFKFTFRNVTEEDFMTPKLEQEEPRALPEVQDVENYHEGKDFEDNVIQISYDEEISEKDKNLDFHESLEERENSRLNNLTIQEDADLAENSNPLTTVIFLFKKVFTKFEQNAQKQITFKPADSQYCHTCFRRTP